jgi:hypothetical protein
MKFYWYEFPALPPTMNWKDSIPPLAPYNLISEKTINGIKLEWTKPDSAKDGEFPKYYLIYRFENDEEINLDDPTKILKLILADHLSFYDKVSWTGRTCTTYVVTSLDRTWNESKQYALTEIINN